MKLAIFGGSFNPVHIGHLFLAEEVRIRFGYQKILFVPVNIPPHKTMADGASGQDRVEMLNLAIKDNPFFQVDSLELQRGGVSYTYDTVEELEAKYSSVLEEKIGLIMGDDLVPGFSTWKNAELLPQKTDLILARRMICTPENEVVFQYPHLELGNSILPISSSDIRSRIISSQKDTLKAWRYLVSEPVYEYIVQRRLYGFRDS